MRLKTVVAALSWKIFLQWRKHWIATALQILFPTALFALLIFLKSNLPTGQPKDYPAESFDDVAFFDNIYFLKIGENRTRIDEQEKILFYTPKNDFTDEIMNTVKTSINFIFSSWSNKLSKFQNF